MRAFGIEYGKTVSGMASAFGEGNRQRSRLKDRMGLDVLTVERLHHAYAPGEVVTSDVTFEVKPGEFVSISDRAAARPCFSRAGLKVLRCVAELVRHLRAGRRPAADR